MSDEERTEHHRGDHDPVRDSWVFARLVLLLFAILTVAMLSIGEVRPPAPHPEADAPHGYTWSLVIFIGPIVVLGRWALLHRIGPTTRRAAGLSLAFLVFLGFGVEWLLGHFAFVFPNSRAILGWTLPVLGGRSPVEEFAFFATGFPAILLTYLWSDRAWMSAYHVSDRRLKELSDPLFTFNAWTLGAAVVLLLGALGSRFLSGDRSLPLYFLYLYGVALLPTLLLLPTVRRAINWRALSLTFALLMLVSIVWEADLGVPYGWWGYRREAMLGIYVRPWSGLPIEEPFLWAQASLTTATFFETARLRVVRASR